MSRQAGTRVERLRNKGRRIRLPSPDHWQIFVEKVIDDNGARQILDELDCDCLVALHLVSSPRSDPVIGYIGVSKLLFESLRSAVYKFSIRAPTQKHTFPESIRTWNSVKRAYIRSTIRYLQLIPSKSR